MNNEHVFISKQENLRKCFCLTWNRTREHLRRYRFGEIWIFKAGNKWTSLIEDKKIYKSKLPKFFAENPSLKTHFLKMHDLSNCNNVSLGLETPPAQNPFFEGHNVRWPGFKSQINHYCFSDSGQVLLTSFVKCRYSTFGLFMRIK